MSYQALNFGTVVNDGTGDTLPVAADKINDNFVEIYNLLGSGTQLSSGISATATVVTLTAPTISGVVGGTITSATITTLTGTTFNAGTLALAAGSITDSSGAISFGNENLTTTGSVTAASLDISGNVDIDGTLETDALTINGTTLAETISDTVGAMVSSNTETNITVTYDDADNTLDFAVDFSGVVATTATTLATARTIHGVSFDGSANIDLTEVVQDTVGAMFSSNTETNITATYQDSDGTIDLVIGTLNQDTAGNAATATALETARTIGGTSFDGTANIAVALSATATALANARTIHGVSFDGTANIDLTEVVQDTVGAMFGSNTETGITATYQDSDGTIDLVIGTLNQDTTGSAATLTTARTIGGVSFDGSANINLPGVNTAGNQNTSGTAAVATVATTVTITDNESTNENNAIVFTAGGDVDGGNIGLESDGTLTYNPSTGKITATGFVGALTGDVTGDVTGNADTATALATARTIHGVSFDGSANIDLTEVVQDTVGAMFGSNTETGITVTYQDADGTIDLVVGTLNQNTTGTADKVTVTDSTANTNFPVTFHDESNALLDDTGALRYNPSTGTLLVPNLVVAGTTTQVDTVTMNAENAVIFEGATADDHETTLTIIDPTADRTQRLLNQSGYIPLLATVTTTAITSTPEELNILDGATVVVGEINALDLGSTAVGTAIASKAVILDSNKDYTGIRNFTVSGELDAATGDFSGDVDVDGTLEADAITVNGTALNEFISDTVGAMVSSNTETGIAVTYQDADNTIDFALNAAQTTITSLLATDIKIGEDDQTKIDFETADTINFYAGNEKQLILTDGALTPGADNILDLGSSSVEFKDAYFDGTVTSDAFAGPLTGNVTGNADTATALATARTIGGVSFDGSANINLPGVNTAGNQNTSGTAAVATTVTITDNESTDENNAIVFAAGGDVDGGDLGLESDGTLTYNPSTGKVTATGFVGTLTGNVTGNTSGTAATVTGAAQTNITSLGTLTALTVDNIIINGTNIGHTSDTDSIAIASNGVVTFSQAPVFPDGSINIADLDIDGATDIGAALADADLFIVDDGAGGTNRKSTLARLKTYMSAGSSVAADDLTAGDAAVLLTTSSGNITIDAAADDSDIILKGTDGGVDTTFLTIDGSAAGEATFNAGIVIADAGNIGSASDKDAIAIASDGVVTMNQIPVFSAGINVSGGTIAGTLSTAAQGNVTSLGTLTTLTVDNIIINGTNIGHTSDTDAIAIASNGVVTFSQAPVFPDGSIAVADLDIDGATDIGAAIVDADLFIVDDGAGGTNRKTTAARLKTYINAGVSSAADDISAGDAAVTITTSSGNITIDAAANDSDIILKGTDGGADTTFLTIDGSAAGEATFNAGIVIADAGNIGSASDKDAIAIASDGVVTMNQIPVFSAGINVSSGTIAGTLSTAAQGNITSLGTLTTLTVDNVVINGATIGHGDDTDLMTVADGILTVAGEVSMTTLDIGGTNVTSTAAELNALDGITAVVGELNALDLGSTAVGNAIASKAVILDSNKDYTGVRNFTLSGELDAGSLDVSGNVDIDGTLEADAITVNGTALAEFISDTAGAMVSSNTETGIAVTYQDGDNTIDFAINAAQTTITSLLATDIKIGEDDQTKIDFETADEIHFYAANEHQIKLVNGALVPVTDNDIDLGTSSLEFKDAFFDGTVTSDAFAGPLTGDVTGTSSKVTVTNSTANTNFPVVFNDESDSLLDDTGALRYNPSSGTLLVPNLVVAGTTTQVDTVTMNAQNAVVFEGATADDHETTLTIIDPTGDRTINLPNVSGTIPVLAAASNTQITSTPEELNILDGATVVVGEINALDIGSTAVGTAVASKAVILDSSKDYTGLRNFTIDGDLDVGDDLFLTSDAAKITFGANSEITATHVHNVGLTLTHTATGANTPMVLELKSEEDIITSGNVISALHFSAGDSDGTDGATVAAAITAEAEGTFSASANATKLVFTTGVSETASRVGGVSNPKMTLASDGDLTLHAGTVTATGFVGNADTATALATARTIGGVSFDGSANINLPGVNSAGNQNTSGSAATLTTARTIGGVSFNGSANINLPGVNSAGNQNTSGSAATVTGAAQTNITSVGTLTALTVDNIIINGTNIGHTSDTDAIAIASNGVVTFSQIPVMPANSIDSDEYIDGSIDREHLAADIIDGTKIADNAINSEHYVDGSIDGVHIANAGISNSKLSANSVDSAQYVDASIDTAHIANAQITVAKMAANSVDSDQYVDGSIDTAHIADNQITLAKMAGIARGKIIYGDASGNPAVLTAGSNTQVLTSDGTDISWADAAGGGAADDISAGDGAVNITTSSGNITIDAAANDSDIIFKGTDGGADITMLTLDGSADGAAIFKSTVTATGIIIGSTAVTSTAAELNYNDITTLGTVEASKTVTADASGDVLFPDSDKAKFGTDSDLQIYHDNSNGYIVNNAGNLIIDDQGGGGITLKYSTETMATFAPDGAASLYYDNAKKFETTAAGVTITGNIIIPNTGNIGSVGDTDAIAIASNGVVTFSQAPVFPDGSIAVADLDIDGATDIGAAIADADLFIIDDGAGGTNRKTTAARLKTYIDAASAPVQLLIKDVDDAVIAIRVGLASGGTDVEIQNSAGTALKSMTGAFTYADAALAA